MKVYIICPVRNASAEQIKALKEYKTRLVQQGHEVFYPADDNQFENTDTRGFLICANNRIKLSEADEVHIFYDPNSSGSLFDLGMAFALCKPLVIANKKDVATTKTKSFANMILHWVGLHG